MNDKPRNKAQAAAYDVALRTLLSMDTDKIWDRAFTRIGPNVDANYMIRVKSHGKASSKVLM